FVHLSPPHHRHLHSFPTRRSSDLAFAHRSGGSSDPCSFVPSLLYRRPSRPRCHSEGSEKCLFIQPSLRPILRLQLQSLNPPKRIDRKSTRLNSSHLVISYAVFCLK